MNNHYCLMKRDRETLCNLQVSFGRDKDFAGVIHIAGDLCLFGTTGLN